MSAHHDVQHDTQVPADSDDPGVRVAEVVTSRDDLHQSIADVLNQSSAGTAFCANIHWIVSFVDEKKRPLGIVLLDSGAMINIENDLTRFVGYLEPSNIKIGLAGKGTLMRNGGVGTRRRLFRTTDGNVYVHEDKAYYCPDAAHPIMSVSYWE